MNGERGEGVLRMNNDEKPIGVAVLGLGNVGREVVRIIEESASDLTARIGAPLVLRGIGVRRVADDRGVPIDLLFTDVVMPGGLDGRALAEAARRLRPLLRVLFTSGFTAAAASRSL